jgi:hypothetical protein
MATILDIAMKPAVAGNGPVSSNGDLGQTAARELRIRHMRELYRYTKLSEWVFDIAFRILLNLGNWITALAYGLKAGFTCFHERRYSFAEERKKHPPVFVSEAEASRHLKELERKVTLIIR